MKCQKLCIRSVSLIPWNLYVYALWLSVEDFNIMVKVIGIRPMAPVLNTGPLEVSEHKY